MTNRITDDELNQVERLARAATQGDWGVDDGNLLFGIDAGEFQQTEIVTMKQDYGCYDGCEAWEAGIAKRENAEFIAQMDPPFVLRLVEEVRRLRLVVETAKQTNCGCIVCVKARAVSGGAQ